MFIQSFASLQYIGEAASKPHLALISLWGIAFLLLFSVRTHAQTYLLSYSTDNQTKEAVIGTPQSMVKDEQGLIWLTTKEGLLRFDGKQFKKYSLENGLRKLPVSSRLYTAFRYLWVFYPEVNTEDLFVNQVDIFDKITNKAVPIEVFFKGKLPFDWAAVVSLKIVGQYVYVALNNGEMFCYEPEKGFLPTKSLMNNNVLTLFPNAEYVSNELAATDSITLQLKPQLNRPSFATLRLKNQDKLQLKLIATPDGRFFLQKNYILQSDTHNAANKNFITNEVFHSELYALEKSNRLRLIAENKNQNNWFCYATFIPSLHLFWWVEKENAAVKLLTTDGKVVLNQTMPFSKLGNLALATDNQIWQTTSDGLVKIEIVAHYFKNVFNQFEKKVGFRGICRINNTLFYACEKGVFAQKDNEAAKIVLPTGLALLPDGNGNLWTGNNNSIFRYNLNAAAPTVTRLPAYINAAWGMWRCDDGQILVSENGVFRYNPATQALTPIAYNGFEELQRHTVYYFYRLSQKRLLLCSTSGLYEMDTDKGIVARYWTGGKGKYYLPSDDFRHLYFDKNTATYWLATGNIGLIAWQRDKNTHQQYTFEKNTTNVVHAVYADKYGFLWLPTEEGLVQFKKNTQQFRIYTTEDGLQNNEFNRIAHFQDTDGTLYFGGIDGVTIFHPKHFNTLFAKKIDVTPFVIEVQQYIGKSNKEEWVTADFIKRNTIVLQPRDRYVKLLLGLKQTKWNDNAVYFFQIKGYDKDWTALKSNELMLGRLPYGRQKVVVKVLLSDGRFADTILEIPILVKRPFYLTWWFLLLLLAALGALVYWRISDLNKRNLLLEQEVAQRTQKIAQQTAELQQLDELKSRFFANVSHELRTPLTLIISPAEELRRQTVGNNKLHSFAQSVEKNSRRLLRLVNQILDLNKLDANALEVKEEAINLIPFLRQRLALFESHAQRKNIALHLAPHPEFSVWLDVNKVATILDNLLSNALKFTTEGGSVTLKVGQQADKLHLSVSDTGRGISSEDLPRIFDRFYQSKQNKIAEGGTGIGLAFSRELADLMKGELTVSSELGKGSIFTLILPCVVCENAPVLSPEPDEIVAKTTFAAQPENIETDVAHLLIVEDNYDLQDYLKGLLQPNYRLTFAANGAEALQLLQQNLAPDLIVSDLMMPIMDGLQFLDAVKTQEVVQKIPFIMLTARAGLDDRLTALRKGVDDYIAKPFSEEELQTRIANLLQRAEVRKSVQAEQQGDNEDAAIQPANAEETDFIQQVETYASAHLTEPDFTLDALAEHFGISRTTLGRRLKAATGLSSSDYILELRLLQVRIFLETKTHPTFKAAAQAVGVLSTKNFSRQFYQRFGRYPSDYLAD